MTVVNQYSALRTEITVLRGFVPIGYGDVILSRSKMPDMRLYDLQGVPMPSGQYDLLYSNEQQLVVVAGLVQ